MVPVLTEDTLSLSSAAVNSMDRGMCEESSSYHSKGRSAEWFQFRDAAE